MREIYGKYFYIPKHIKIHENVMVARIAMSVTIILLSLIVMSFSAYAYFSHDTTSQFDIIRSASFETNIDVKVIDENGVTIESITPITSNYKTFKVEGLIANKTYTIIITPTEHSSAETGFIILKAIRSNEIYHTQQLGIDKSSQNGKTEQIAFTLTLTNPSEIIFETHWGTSAHYPQYKDRGDNDKFYITQNEKIEIALDSNT